MLERQQQDWNELGKLDPLWAVLSDPARQFGRWNLDEFFRTGAELVWRIRETAAPYGLPRASHRALDFGCGVGRLTRALAPFFTECWGIDISEEMIRQARELNAAVANCGFAVNTDPDLRAFPENQFDFILCVLVLQHFPSRSWILALLAEFLRVLRGGGLLVFQLPSFIPLRNRVQPRRRAYEVLRRAGVRRDVLYRSLGLNPIRMNHIPRDEVIEFISRRGGTVVFDETQTIMQKGAIRSTTYYVTRSV